MLPHIGFVIRPILIRTYCKPSALPRAFKHARQMGMLCQPSQVKREEEGGRGSYKFLQFLTLPPKTSVSGVTFQNYFVSGGKNYESKH